MSIDIIKPQCYNVINLYGGQNNTHIYILIEEETQMKILNTDTATANDKVLTYKLTRSPEVVKLSTLAGQRIDVTHFCEYEDEKPDRKTGEINTATITAFMTREGELFASNSATVREEWENILEIFGADLDKEGGYIPVRIIEGMSKNQRKFLTLTYGA